MSAVVDAGDALVVHVAGHDPDPEGDRGDDGGLGRGVVPLDVRGGVAFGVAQALRLAEGVGVGRTRLGHAGEDVVRRAVDDAHDAVDALAGERLAQRPDERDATRHGCLEQQVDAGLLGGREQVRADVGQQLLVAGDHRLARLERGEHQLACRLDAADDLDDDVDLGVDHDPGGVEREHVLGQLDRTLLGQAPHRHTGHLEEHPGAGGDGVAAAVDEIDQRRADVAAAQQTDADAFGSHDGQCYGRDWPARKAVAASGADRWSLCERTPRGWS